MTSSNKVLKLHNQSSSQDLPAQPSGAHQGSQARLDINNQHSIGNNTPRSLSPTLASAPTPLRPAVQSISAQHHRSTYASVMGAPGSDAKVSSASTTSVKYQKSKCADVGSTPVLPLHRTPDALQSTIVDSLVVQEAPRTALLPGDDEPIEDTLQLFHCCRLLDMERNSSRPLLSTLVLTNPSPTAHDNDQEEWIRYMEINPLERKHLFSVIARIASTFMIEPTSDPDSIREVVLIGPLLNKGKHHELVKIFHQKFLQSASLDINILLGLVQLIHDGPSEPLTVENLIRILGSVRARLKDSTGKDTEDTIYLIRAIATLLTPLAIYQSKDQNCTTEFKRLSKILSALTKHRNPLIKFQARYTEEILLSVSGQLRTDDTPNFTGAHGLYKLLRTPLKFHDNKQWFQDVQKARGFVQDHLRLDLHKLFCEEPSISNTNFQWHACQLLGELSVDPSWDDDTRQQALELLHEYTKVNGTMKSRPVIRRWALTILRHVSEISPIPTAAGNYDPRTVYNEAAKDKKRGWLLGFGTRRVKPFDITHPLTSSLPLPSKYPLLQKVNAHPDVEFAIDRLLRQRSRAYDTRSVYIQLLAKHNVHAPEDALVELQVRARKFLESKGEVFLVLGDSGAGKSTFSMRLENELWTEYKPGEPIPLFIDLKTIDSTEKDMIHQHLDDLGFFTEQQMEDMRRSRRFILICDGYDEFHKWTNLHTRNQFNGPRQWQVKMIISCRTQYLRPNYRNYFEPETATPSSPNFSNTSDLFEEAVIVPFRSAQIKEYIDLFTKAPRTMEHLDGGSKWSTEQYMDRLRNITHLMDLAKNPFMLKMILDVLPTIAQSTKKISRVDLYDHFVDLHFKSEQQRLMKQHANGKMDNATLSAFVSLENNDLFDLGMDFSKQLSLYIFKDLGRVNSVTYSTVLDGGSWKDAFFGSDGRVKLLRQSAQLVCRENKNDPRRLIRHGFRPSRKGNSYEFSHRSILEYFYSCLIFDPRGNAPQLDLAACLASTDSPLSVISHPLGQSNIVSEYSVIHFLAERVHQSKDFQAQLHTVLHLSKAEAATSLAASNAITIMVQARQLFNGADLRGVRIPGADLSCGDFDSVQLQGADLRRTTFRNAWLHRADLSHSQMEGITFGQLPYLEVVSEPACCVFSPDGGHLVVGLFNGTINTYNTLTWDKVLPQGPTGIQNDNENISTFSGLPRTPVSVLSGHAGRVTCITFSPSGHQIASSSWDRTVRLWDARTGILVSTLSDHPAKVSSVAYSPNGHKIASGSWDNVVRLWDVQTGVLVLTLGGHTDRVDSVAYSPSGHQIASGSWDKTVRLWDTQSGVAVSTLSGHTDWVTSVTYSPSGHQIATGSNDTTVRLWDAQTGAHTLTLSGHVATVSSVRYSPSGHQIASGCWENTVRIWDAQTGALNSSLSGSGLVNSVAYSPSGHQIVSCTSEKRVRLWDAQTSADASSLSDHTQSVASIAYSPRGHHIASGSFDTTVRLWDAETGVLAQTLNGHTSFVNSVEYSPRGHQIVSGSSDTTIRLWDAHTGALISVLRGHTEAVEAVAFSPSGQQIASGGWDKTVRLWGAQLGNLASTLRGHVQAIQFVVYSPNGLQIASASLDTTVRLWDVQTGTLIFSMSDHTEPVQSLAYSIDGLQLVSGSDDGTVRLWDVQTGTVVSTLNGHTGFVNSVAYSPTGHQIISSSHDETLRLWDTRSGQCLATLSGFQDALLCLSWKATLGGSYIAASGMSKSVSMWKVVEDEKEVRLCLHWRSAPRKLILSKASVLGVQDLSAMNRRLLQQRQAVGLSESP